MLLVLKTLISLQSFLFSIMHVVITAATNNVAHSAAIVRLSPILLIHIHMEGPIRAYLPTVLHPSSPWYCSSYPHLQLPAYHFLTAALMLIIMRTSQMTYSKQWYHSWCHCCWHSWQQQSCSLGLPDEQVQLQYGLFSNNITFFMINLLVLKLVSTYTACDIIPNFALAIT